MKRMSSLWTWMILALSVIWAPFAWSDDEVKPDPVLEIVFLDAQNVVQSRSTMMMDELRALPSAEFETTTVWTDGKQHFRGVWLSDLMAHLQITEGTIYLSALNEYLVEFSLEEIVPGGALLAYERNHAPMGPRDKGPLWVVFPYDSDPQFQTESVFAQSIWQMDRIEVYR